MTADDRFGASSGQSIALLRRGHPTDFYAPGRFRSVIDPMRGAAYRKGLLRRPPIRLPLILACRPALLELLLQRTERLVSRAANGADQSDAVLEERVEILAHKPML